MYGKSWDEMAKITLEAARRVKAGESQADVAQALGIPPSTLADWARRGGWRRKDLIAVHDAERGQAVKELIARFDAELRERDLRDMAELRAADRESRKELEGAALESDPEAEDRARVPAPKLAMIVADDFLRQGRLADADLAVRLAQRFADAEHAANAREETRWRDERNRLTKWWAAKQTAYHRLHAVTASTISKLEDLHRMQDSRMADDLCPSCGRRMDFWPEEIERPEESGEPEESRFSEESAFSGESGESGESANRSGLSGSPGGEFP